jgi:triphosphoribosyl-dephospho-CoA synthetase
MARAAPPGPRGPGGRREQTMDIRREILRNVVLCQAIEPLGNKPGLTSRAADASPDTRLEYFVVAAANSAWAFYDLADRVLAAGRQPEAIFDLAYEAQAASVRNRLGGKVNDGQIGLLVPIVTAQVLAYLEEGATDDVEAILSRTPEVLRRTTEKDVQALERFLHLGDEIAARHQERMGNPAPAPRAGSHGRYASVWDAAQSLQHIHALREMAQGYPHCRRIYRFLLHNLETGVIPASELLYRFLFPEIGQADAVADMICVGFYLMLTRHPETVLFP